MSRQAHEMGGFKRNGVVLLILVAAVSGFGYIPSIPKICINQGYGGVAHFTSVGSSRGYDLFPPNGMNSMSLAGGGGRNRGRRGGRGGGVVGMPGAEMTRMPVWKGTVAGIHVVIVILELFWY